jgi:hypothetical protein
VARESTVPFSVIGGRVYHRNLELVFPGLTIKTEGSVGFDRTLSLVAEMPIPPKWMKSARVKGALANQTIRLPIGGTLDRPKIDERALREAAGQFVRQAAGRMIQNELENEIQKLLHPPK